MEHAGKECADDLKFDTTVNTAIWLLAILACATVCLTAPATFLGWLACAACLVAGSGTFTLSDFKDLRNYDKCLAKRRIECKGLKGEPNADDLPIGGSDGPSHWEGDWGIGSTCNSFNWVANAECHGTLQIDPLKWTMEAAQIGF